MFELSGVGTRESVTKDRLLNVCMGDETNSEVAQEDVDRNLGLR